MKLSTAHHNHATHYLKKSYTHTHIHPHTYNHPQPPTTINTPTQKHTPILSMTTSGLLENGRVIMDRRIVRTTYIQHWLPLDIISAFPLSAVAVASQLQGPAAVAVRAPNMIRLVKLPHTLTNLGRCVTCGGGGGGQHAVVVLWDDAGHVMGLTVVMQLTIIIQSHNILRADHRYGV